MRNVKKFPWLYSNPAFDIDEQKQRLRWGNIKAVFRRGEYATELEFYYNGEKLKTYDTKRPSLEWVGSCLNKFLDSKILDMEIKEKDDERTLTEIIALYRELTNSLR
jgi:hypothetical protein